MKGILNFLTFWIGWPLRMFGVSVKVSQTIGYVVLALIVLIAFGLVYSKCFHRSATIDQEKINKINKANEIERKAELKVIVDQNADVIKTVDERNTLTNIDIEARSAEAQKKVDEVDAKIQKIQQDQGRDVTQEEFLCLLQPSECVK